MAENPVRRLARLLGGVVLMQGRLGHQVLGQLLVADAGDAVLAGAMMVITGTARQRNIVAQAAIRTAAPALAAHWLLRSRALHIARREAGHAERELKQQRIEILRAQIRHRSARRLTGLEVGSGIVIVQAPPLAIHSPDLVAARKNLDQPRRREKRPPKAASTPPPEPRAKPKKTAVRPRAKPRNRKG